MVILEDFLTESYISERSRIFSLGLREVFSWEEFEVRRKRAFIFVGVNYMQGKLKSEVSHFLYFSKKIFFEFFFKNSRIRPALKK